MVKIAIRGILTAVLVISTTAISSSLSYAQSLTGEAPEAGSSAQSPTNVSAPIVFGKLSILGKGPTTTAIGACADAPCPSGDSCTGCISWNGLVLQGGFNGSPFAAPTLTGDFTADVTHEITSGSGTGICFQGAGPATVFTNAAKTGSIQMALIGQICAASSGSPILQFSGSYLVTGGTGVYSTAAGSGTVTADLSNAFGTSRHTVQMNGTLLR